MGLPEKITWAPAGRRGPRARIYREIPAWATEIRGPRSVGPRPKIRGATGILRGNRVRYVGPCEKIVFTGPRGLNAWATSTWALTKITERDLPKSVNLPVGPTGTGGLAGGKLGYRRNRIELRICVELAWAEYVGLSWAHREIRVGPTWKSRGPIALIPSRNVLGCESIAWPPEIAWAPRENPRGLNQIKAPFEGKSVGPQEGVDGGKSCLRGSFCRKSRVGPRRAAWALWREF